MKFNNLYIKFLIQFFFSSTVITRAQLTPKEAINQMSKGINLGNTLEPPLEDDWGNPPAQEYYFDMYNKCKYLRNRFSNFKPGYSFQSLFSSVDFRQPEIQ